MTHQLTQPAHSSESLRRPKRFILISNLLRSLLLCIIILLSAFTWILSTETGLHFLVKQVQYWLPGELHINKLQGRLLDNFSLSGLSYRNQETVVQIAFFQLTWVASDLLQAKLHLQQLQVDNVIVHLPLAAAQPAAKNPDPLELPNFNLPVRIALDNIQIRQVIIVQSANSAPLQIANIELHSTTTDTLSWQQLQVQSTLWQAKLAGTVGLQHPYSVQLHLDWSVLLPKAPPLVGQGEIRGNLQQLTVTHTVRPPLATRFTATLHDLLGALRFEAAMNWQDLAWPLTTNTKNIKSAAGHLTASGTLEKYHLALTTHLAGASIPNSQWNILVQGNLQELMVERLRTDLWQGRLEATGKVAWQPQLTAQVNLSTQNISLADVWKDWPVGATLDSQLVANLEGNNFNIKQLSLSLPPTDTHLSLQGEGSLVNNQPLLKTALLTWHNLHWPLFGKQSLVNSPNGRLHVSGILENYRFALDSHLSASSIPESQWNILGQGNLQKVALEKISMELIDGVITGKGEVKWQPVLAAQINLRADKLNVEKIWPVWPAELRLNSQIDAKLEGETFTLDRLEASLSTTATKLLLQGRGSWADKQNPKFKTTLTWQGLQWPFASKPPSPRPPVGVEASAGIINSSFGQLNLEGSLQDYHFNLDSLLAGQSVPRQHLVATGQGNWQQLTLAKLRTDLLTGAITATGQVSWQPSLTAQLQLDADQLGFQELWPDWPANLKLNSHLVANLAGTEFKITQWEVTLPQTATQMVLQGNGSWSGPLPRVQATIAWQGLRWPLLPGPLEKVLISSTKGTITATGTPQAYQVKIDTNIQGQNLPQSRWQAVGQGDSNSLQLNSLTGKVWQGTLGVTGKIRWQPALTWELALQGDHLNPGQQWPDWPGKIALDIHSQGQFQAGILTTQVAVKQLQGQLRNYPLQLQTTLGIKGQEYEIKGLHFQSGSSRLTVNGKIGPHSNLTWDLKVPDFATVWPAAKGSLQGHGSYRGSLTSPHLTVQWQGRDWQFQDQRLTTVQGDMDVNLQIEQESRLQIVVTGFKQGQTQIERLQLQGQGKRAQHTLVANLTMPPHDQLSLHLQGSFQPPQSESLNSLRWQGQLQQFTVAIAKLGSAWELATPVALSLSPTEAQLDRLCLSNADSAKLCTQLHWQPTATSNIQANLEKIPLSLLQAFLPSQATLTGALTGTLVAAVRPEGTVTSTANFHLSPGLFTTPVNAEVEEFAHHGGHLSWQLNPDGLIANVDLKLLKNSSLVGKVSLPQFTLLPSVRKTETNGHSQPLQGQLQATFDDLSILPTFVPQAENTQGQVNLDLVLAGTLAAPQVQGRLRIANVATDLPDLGLQLNNLNMTITANDPHTLQMQAKLNSGEGSLRLQGEVKLPSLTHWNGQLQITGNNFEVINLPMARALVSPQMAVQLSPSGILVTGELIIPQAAITPPEATPGTVAVSTDVVLINPTHPQPVETEVKTAGALPITSNLTIRLGDQVTFKGAGFKSHLRGVLRAGNTPGKVTIGNGEVLIEGIYKAYGQDLTVTGGRVIFTGGPVDNPGLDIRAFRRIYQPGRREESSTGTTIRSDEEVIAGVYIHGTVKSPEITLYSQPALDQSNILSYIVLGKPVSQASGEEGKSLLGAAVASQFQGSGDSLPQKIANQFGLDEASISSKGGVTDSELVVGKYLSPELYISYGVGLFDARTVLRIRYQLTKWLMLETETGSQSGVDLRYSLER